MQKKKKDGQHGKRDGEEARAVRERSQKTLGRWGEGGGVGRVLLNAAILQISPRARRVPVPI